MTQKSWGRFYSWAPIQILVRGSTPCTLWTRAAVPCITPKESSRFSSSLLRCIFHFSSGPLTPTTAVAPSIGREERAQSSPSRPFSTAQRPCVCWLKRTWPCPSDFCHRCRVCVSPPYSDSTLLDRNLLCRLNPLCSQCPRSGNYPAWYLGGLCAPHEPSLCAWSFKPRSTSKSSGQSAACTAKRHPPARDPANPSPSHGTGHWDLLNLFRYSRDQAHKLHVKKR